MNLNELIEALGDYRTYLFDVAGLNADDCQVVVWDGDDVAPVVGFDYDQFEVDGPWTVEIRKVNDP